MASVSLYGYDSATLAAVNAFSSIGASQAAITTTLETSPNQASLPPKRTCLLLKLPHEIQTQVLSFILPRTIRSPTKDVVWLRGNTAIFSTCRAMYEICEDIVYRRSVFLVDVHFNRIIFNYQWLIATDVSKPDYGRNLGPEYSTQMVGHKLVPSSKMDFMTKFSPDLKGVMGRFAVRIHLVDGYDGMIMYNTAKEEVLMKGLVRQIERFYTAVGTDRETRRRKELSFKLVGGPALQDQFQEICPTLGQNPWQDS